MQTIFQRLQCFRQNCFANQDELGIEEGSEARLRLEYIDWPQFVTE